MQKGTDETQTVREGHARQDSALTHGMAKLLHVINIYALGMHQTARERERKTGGKEETHPTHSMRCSYVLQSLPQLRQCNRHSPQRFFGSVYFIFIVYKSRSATRITGLQLHGAH